MTCRDHLALRTGWRRLLPPNPFKCEFCGYYVIGFYGMAAMILLVIYACLSKP